MRIAAFRFSEIVRNATEDFHDDFTYGGNGFSRIIKDLIFLFKMVLMLYRYFENMKVHFKDLS